MIARKWRSLWKTGYGDRKTVEGAVFALQEDIHTVAGIILDDAGIPSEADTLLGHKEFPQTDVL